MSWHEYDEYRDVNDLTGVELYYDDLRIYPEYLDINDQLRLKRVHDNFSQIELGSLLGVGASTISQIESGKQEIPKKKMEIFDAYLYRKWYANKELIHDIDENEEEY